MTFNVTRKAGNCQQRRVTVFFFFNPFVGDVLAQVARRIRDWSGGKDFRIVFCNHDHFDKLLAIDPWLEKTAYGLMAPNVSWAVYKPVPV
jgi:hypothetical protein